MADLNKKPYKAHLFWHNNPIGQIINPVADNEIPDAPTFSDRANKWSATERDKWVNKYLTDQSKAIKDYKILVENETSMRTIKRINESTFELWVNKANNHLPTEKLLNKDFGVIKSEENGLYYFVNVYLKKNLRGYCIFGADIEHLTTCGAEFRSNSKNLLFEGHTDRYDLNLKPLVEKLFFNEDLTNEPTKKSYSVIKNKIKDLEVNDFFILYFNLNSKLETTHFSTTNGALITLPYTIGIKNFNENIRIKGTLTDNSTFEWVVIGPDFNKNGKDYLGRFLIRYWPFDLQGSTFTRDGRGYLIIQSDNSKKFLKYKLEGDRVSYVSQQFILVKNKESDQQVELYFNRIFTSKKELQLPNFQDEKIFKLTSNDLRINQNRNPNYEPKLVSNQFTKYELKHFSGATVEINYLRATGKLYSNSNFSPQSLAISFWVEEKFLDRWVESQKLDIVNNSATPSKETASDTYFRDNSNQRNNQIFYNNLQKKEEMKQLRRDRNISTATNFLSDLFSSFTDTLSGDAQGPAEAFGRTAETYTNKQKLTDRPNDIITSREADLNNQLPSLTPGNNSIYEIDKNISNNLVYLVKTELNDINKQMVYDKLTQKGYKDGRVLDLNQVIKSRFYFNYVRANGCFNNIEPADKRYEFSSKVKQLLAGSFQIGITFWHIREGHQWIGFRNFTKENWEWSLLKKFNKV